MDRAKQLIKPVAIALTVMVLYQLLISPIINDLIQDWQFLHFARMKAIEQVNQQQKK